MVLTKEIAVGIFVGAVEQKKYSTECSASECVSLAKSTICDAASGMWHSAGPDIQSAFTFEPLVDCHCSKSIFLKIQ
jgi:hypothetical protein